MVKLVVVIGGKEVVTPSPEQKKEILKILSPTFKEVSGEAHPFPERGDNFTTEFEWISQQELK